MPVTPADEPALVTERLGKDPGLCRWFALCTNEATKTEPHPTLGDVKICDRCKGRVDRLRALNRTQRNAAEPIRPSRKDAPST